VVNKERGERKKKGVAGAADNGRTQADEQDFSFLFALEVPTEKMWSLR